MDQYEVLDEIGRGGMGIVLKAHDTVLQRTVAVKVLGRLTDDAQGRERFIREARSAAAVSHEHVVAVYGFGGLAQTPTW